MRFLIVASWVVAVALGVSAAKVPPNTNPTAATKGGSRVSKLDTANKTRKPKNANQAESPVPLCNQGLPCFVVVEPQSKSKQEQENEASLDRLYRRYMYATIVGVGGGLIGVFFLVWQTILTRTSADAARLNAQAVIDSERAWVVASPAILRPPIGFIPEQNDPLDAPGRDAANTFYVFFRNSGTTPAKILKTCAIYETIANMDSLPAEPLYPDVPERRGVFLFNQKNTDGGDEKIGQLAYLSPDPILTKEQVRAVKTAKLFLYAYGFVLYEDAFKRSHTMRFGYVYRFPRPGQLQLEGFWPEGPPKYNEAD